MRDPTECNTTREQTTPHAAITRVDSACFEKRPSLTRSESCERPQRCTPLVVKEQPQSFADWQWVLQETAKIKEKGKAARRIVIETDPCFEHADKRRRVSPDITEEQDQVKSVLVSISSEARSYRRQQESSGSSNDVSTTSVEPKWSDSDEESSEEHAVISVTAETESLSTVLSQQMDYVSLSNVAAEADIEINVKGS